MLTPISINIAHYFTKKPSPDTDSLDDISITPGGPTRRTPTARAQASAKPTLKAHLFLFF